MEGREKGGKLPIPGAKARKRKAKSNRVDDEVVEYNNRKQRNDDSR